MDKFKALVQGWLLSISIVTVFIDLSQRIVHYVLNSALWAFKLVALQYYILAALHIGFLVALWWTFTKAISQKGLRVLLDGKALAAVLGFVLSARLLLDILLLLFDV